ncbi:hypothetical protein [Streptomyces sp. NPDC014006]|uniref:hypothetical protein n=1 Tax=Streptomyces sp. NPDC014006 TaxID=3364870 RepID=UPI0036FC04AF
MLGRVSDRPEVALWVQRVVDDLDDTIKTVRGTIYALRERDRSDGRGGLRSKLLAETDRAAAVLGFAPALRMTGLLDTDVPADHAEHLLAGVARNAVELAGVARNAVERRPARTRHRRRDHCRD